jgi:hypothetical protein
VATRDQYVLEVGSELDAARFEIACLGMGPNAIPSCALPVLDGGKAADPDAYYDWLILEWHTYKGLS